MGLISSAPGDPGDDARGLIHDGGSTWLNVVAFAGSLVPWLMFNRHGLDILVHPLTDDEVEDHTTHAVWLGTPVDLLTDRLRQAPTIGELQPN